MSADFPAYPDSGCELPNEPSVEGVARRGQPCRLIDASGDQLPEVELRDILHRLIEQDAFGFKPLSAAGGDTLELDAPATAHVQIGEQLYRLIVQRYQARIEKF